DSRRILRPDSTLFVAIETKANDGHLFIQDAYDKGVRHFLVQQDVHDEKFPYAIFLKVEDTVIALQQIAQFHRKNFDIPIVGITGSNGKTIIKEWISQCLQNEMDVCKNPGSYNSQIGVPISILALEKYHEIGIFEAGISLPGEMIRHLEVLQPTIGIFSNIGDAHESGFTSKSEKLNEKLTLFQSCKTVIYNRDQKEVDDAFHNSGLPSFFTWGKDEENNIQLLKVTIEAASTYVELQTDDRCYMLELPFINNHLIENCMHVISFLIYSGWTCTKIQNAIDGLSSIEHRLEIKQGIKESLLINDSYSLDLASMELALEYQAQYSNRRPKIVFISDFEHQKDKGNLFIALVDLLKKHEVYQTVIIGLEPSYRPLFEDLNCSFYDSTQSCLAEYNFEQIRSSCVLVKGARIHKFELLLEAMSKQVHKTVLECDFGAVANNLRVYRSMLDAPTKMMAVVKAEAYGSGSIQLAHFLERKKVDYLAVALIDEAINIRESGCNMPIMVFNVQNENLNLLWRYKLEPEVYSMHLLHDLLEASQSQEQPLSIHLKIDSGMHRLGFDEDEFDALCNVLESAPMLHVKSIFSHLASSESSEDDAFTREQFKTFDSAYNYICSRLQYNPIKHILNTGGIVRHGMHQYDMVRIGLGLYGIDATKEIQHQLQQALSLKGRILQINALAAGESTGYNRSGKVNKSSQIAVISIGYADGLMRKAGNGRFEVMIKGKVFPTIGNICMDVCMVDITGAEEINAGDEVIIFSPQYSINKLADACETISYEIISRIAPRVKRLYIHK
ncbi:MAG: bifunctional UDP-N-acetylmuramoyl-tripeptide:D-alanyl-D-alanine ligase/alanine racemase, partial [Saprospiraceae bacterium]|nr:bifunctional UDP-N-acetylmuramoyl-tripeptide:D-alanyl-D-alanine ligase/alanine racemase [Saprospiraceae bacterium]